MIKLPRKNISKEIKRQFYKRSKIICGLEKSQSTSQTRNPVLNYSIQHS
jgi:hypothetical protein